MISTHASRLDRWLGRSESERISKSMKDWYGPPIAVANVPGNVWAHKGGDFSGRIRAGQLCHALDFADHRFKRIMRNSARRQKNKLNAGFASLSDLILEATTGGKRYTFTFQKVGPTGVVAVTSSLWGLGNFPAAGANASNAPGGDAPTDATTGAFLFTNPSGGDTLHFVTGYTSANIVNNTLLLYDRIFQVNKTMASTSTEAVTGVPTRYQNQIGGTADYIGGNFLFVEVGVTALAATAHNWTVCLYTNQGGVSSTLPSLTGNASAIVRRLDHPVSQWFAPIAAGDVGVKALTQMQCSASVATGVINFVIGHPIAWFPHPIINTVFIADGINTAFNLTRIFNDAALAFLEVTKPTTTATTYTGFLEAVAG